MLDGTEPPGVKINRGVHMKIWVYATVAYVASATIVSLIYIHLNEKRQQALEDAKKKIYSKPDGET